MTEDEAAEQLAVFRAILDQDAQAASEYARVVACYHSRLIAGGVDPDAALVLTLDFQQSYLRRLLPAG